MKIFDGGKLRRAADYPRSLIFPERCALCGRVILVTTDVCGGCRKDAEVIKPPKCRYCGDSEKNCRCGKQATFFDGITAPFRYTGVVKRGILRWKYGGAWRNTAFFAKSIAAAVKKDFSGIKFDCVTFVPQTESEESEHERNQGEALASEVGKLLNISVEPLLVKTVETCRQHDLPLHRKSGNVFGVFECRSPERISVKTILIIDDIKTSGCTLNECAKMLHLGGAAAVYCGVAAVV